MSKEALAKVVQRAISDGAFRRQLSSDPTTALRGFDLSADESAAIRSGDSGKLSSMGVDLRMSKAFSLASDQATGDAARPVLSNDLGASFTGASSSAGNASAASSALTGGNSAGASNVLTGGNSAGASNVLTGGNSAGASNVLSGGDASSASSALSSGNAAGASNVLSGGDASAASSALSSGNAADNDALISGGGDNFGRDGAITGADPAHALGAATSGDNSGTFGNVLSPGDVTSDGVLVIDDAAHSGASTPGEASSGPTIQE
jgi:hypothetical protein